MPFNAANPTNSEKIRNIGSVIRPNWVAIEQSSESDSQADKLKLWGINFFSRDDIPAAPGNDSPAVDDGIVIYSKTDADTAQPELFTRHEDSTITQLTKGPAVINATSGETSMYGGLLMKYGITGTLSGTSTNSLTFASFSLTDFPNGVFGVWIQSINSGAATNVTPHVNNVAVTGFDLITANAGQAMPYYWWAIGN